MFYFACSKQDIQMTLREEIKSACEYRPFEKCDYIPRASNEICCKKLEYVISQLDEMKETIDNYYDAAWSHSSYFKLQNISSSQALQVVRVANMDQ